MMHDPKPSRGRPLRADELQLLSPIIRRGFDRRVVLLPETLKRLNALEEQDLPALLVLTGIQVLDALAEALPGDHPLMEELPRFRKDAARVLQSYYDLPLSRFGPEPRKREEGPGLETPPSEAAPSPRSVVDRQSISERLERYASGGVEAVLPLVVPQDPATRPESGESHTGETPPVVTEDSSDRALSALRRKLLQRTRDAESLPDVVGASSGSE